MAIILEAAYSKKLGLPNYSSHSLRRQHPHRTLRPLPGRGGKRPALQLLQQSVDNEIQPGRLPARRHHLRHGTAITPTTIAAATATATATVKTIADRPLGRPGATDVWTCSDKQKEFILKLVDEHHLDKKEVEALAKELFGMPVKTLNRLQASGLIDRLARTPRQKKNGNGKAANHGGGKYAIRAVHHHPVMSTLVDTLQPPPTEDADHRTAPAEGQRLQAQRSSSRAG